MRRSRSAAAQLDTRSQCWWKRLRASLAPSTNRLRTSLVCCSTKLLTVKFFVAEDELLVEEGVAEEGCVEGQ